MLSSMSIVMQRKLRLSIIVLAAALGIAPQAAFAQGGDLTLFVGTAYPIDREEFTLRPSTPSLPGADVTVTGDPALRASGGLVLGGALAFEVGVIGIEGRLDSTNIGFDVDGARYDLRGTSPPFQGLTGAITIADGHLDAERFNILSANLRVRTPGSVGLVASAGFSILPDVTINGSVPISAQIAGVPLPGAQPRLRLEVAAGESKHRYGVNAGGGLRIGGSRLAVMGEVRVFYFKDYELTFGVEGAPSIVSDLIREIPVIAFDPVIVNAQAGLVVTF
jgi:hypothetical protein